MWLPRPPHCFIPAASLGRKSGLSNQTLLVSKITRGLQGVIYDVPGASIPVLFFLPGERTVLSALRGHGGHQGLKVGGEGLLHPERVCGPGTGSWGATWGGKAATWSSYNRGWLQLLEQGGGRPRAPALSHQDQALAWEELCGWAPL